MRVPAKRTHERALPTPRARQAALARPGLGLVMMEAAAVVPAQAAVAIAKPADAAFGEIRVPQHAMR